MKSVAESLDKGELTAYIQAFAHVRKARAQTKDQIMNSLVLDGFDPRTVNAQVNGYWNNTRKRPEKFDAMVQKLAASETDYRR